MQQLFEGRHTPGVHLTSQAACALFGAGYTSGIVAHGGHRGIEVIPVYEGAQLHHARTVTRGGGEQMTENLRVYMRDECATPMNVSRFSYGRAILSIPFRHSQKWTISDLCVNVTPVFTAPNSVLAQLSEKRNLNFRTGTLSTFKMAFVDALRIFCHRQTCMKKYFQGWFK